PRRDAGAALADAQRLGDLIEAERLITGEQQPKNAANAQRETIPSIEAADVVSDDQANVFLRPCPLVLYFQHILNIANIESLRDPAHPGSAHSPRHDAISRDEPEAV